MKTREIGQATGGGPRGLLNPLAQVALREPFKVGTKEVTALTFRRATAKDVSDLGFPYFVMQTAAGQEVEFKAKIVMRYIARLTGHKESHLSAMGIKDLQVCHAVVQELFGRSNQSDDEAGVMASSKGEHDGC